MEPVAFTAGCAVPVLKVSDVQRSIAWYESLFGFKADPFPNSPPYVFAILCRDGAQIMLQGVEATSDDHRPSRDVHDEWDVYLRIHGGNLLALAAAAENRTKLLRGPERAFYGQVEFEVADPDGHRVCVGEVLPAEADVPRREG
jgi:catechol 2,3-dioxygenase-like lactoylglutathione lyase family enzyme